MVTYTNNNDGNYTDAAWITERCNTTSSLMYGQKFTDAQFYVFKTTTQAGNISCVQIDPDGATEHTFWTKSYNSLPTVVTELSAEVSTPSDIACVVGTRIGIRSSLATDPKVGITVTDTWDGTDSILETNSTTYDTRDMGFSLSTTPPPSTTTVTMPPPYANIGLHGL